MATEIERKFLVVGDGWRTATPARLTQGYLSRDPARTVRVRVEGDAGVLTIKGPTHGASRLEFEYPLPLQDAQVLLSLCDGPVVDKWRHHCTHGGEHWDVDEFLGDNAGLVLAEIELPDEGHTFPRPAWLGAEVTGDVRYYNSQLAVNPWRTWTT